MNQFINKVFNMDNLELMKQIPDNSIDLIYCDILYGTGRDFGDYKDIKANKKDVEDFYMPRIVEMHRILKNTGSIYLHMDWRINHWIRCIMDKVFGYNNFQNEIIWSYKTGGVTKKRWNRKHDNILFYSKTSNFKFNMIKEKSYTVHRKAGMENNYGNRPEMFYEDEKGVFNLTYPRSVWNIPYLNNMASERVDYRTQKPSKLIRKIVEASSDKGDVVADFFCGSGTTPVVVKELERKYIACDISKKAVDITKNRLEEIK